MKKKTGVIVSNIISIFFIFFGPNHSCLSERMMPVSEVNDNALAIFFFFTPPIRQHFRITVHE